MKTEEITVKASGQGIERAVSETEELAFISGLSNKQCLHLRLLAEELLGLMQDVTGQGEARYTVEQCETTYVMELNADVKMTKEVRRKLIELSSRKENAAPKGFMGRLRDSIAAVFLPAGNTSTGMKVGLMGLGSPSDYGTYDTYSWTMTQYMEGVKKAQSEEAEEAMSEMERSIVASIADEVKVHIMGSHVKIMITKEF